MGQKVNSTIFNLGLINSEYNSKYLAKNKNESTLFLYKDVEIKNYIDRIFELYGFIVQTIKIDYSTTKIKIFLKFYRQQNKKKIPNLPLKISNSSKKLVTFIINRYILTSLNLYLKNKKIEIKVQNLNEKFKKNFLKTRKELRDYKKGIKSFRRFTKKNFYNKDFIQNRDFIKAILISLYEKNSSKIIAKLIAINLEKRKKRQFYLFFILKTVIQYGLKSKYSNVKGFKLVVNGRLNGRPRAKKFLFQLGQISLHSFRSDISYYEETAYTTNGTFGIKVWIC